MKHWNDRFISLFQKCVDLYQQGQKDFTCHYDTADLEFLTAIGCQSREFFDFVEDYCEEGEPSLSTTLLVAAARRDYFLTVMKGAPGTARLTRDDIPGFGEELHGIAYLPRIIAKARAKLRGELDPDLMYGCGGDRNFLSKIGGVHPADFLRQIWSAGDDDHAIASWVKSRQEK
jgi:hypothetical protein